jgi:hypothetical protein
MQWCYRDAEAFLPLQTTAIQPYTSCRVSSSQECLDAYLFNQTEVNLADVVGNWSVAAVGVVGSSSLAVWVARCGGRVFVCDSSCRTPGSKTAVEGIGEGRRSSNQGELSNWAGEKGREGTGMVRRTRSIIAACRYSHDGHNWLNFLQTSSYRHDSRPGR